jgi:hypothetical protein
MGKGGAVGALSHAGGQANLFPAEIEEIHCPSPLARIIHELLAAMEGRKEFRTEVTELRHRDHSEVPRCSLCTLWSNASVIRSTKHSVDSV